MKCVVTYDGINEPIIRYGRVIGYTSLGEVRVRYDAGMEVTVRPSHVHLCDTTDEGTQAWRDTIVRAFGGGGQFVQ